MGDVGRGMDAGEGERNASERRLFAVGSASETVAARGRMGGCYRDQDQERGQ